MNTIIPFFIPSVPCDAKCTLGDLLKALFSVIVILWIILPFMAGCMDKDFWPNAECGPFPKNNYDIVFPTYYAGCEVAGWLKK